MKKITAQVTIKAKDCTKRIDIDVTQAAGMTEMFEMIEEAVSVNRIILEGDRVESIYFWECEER